MKLIIFLMAFLLCFSASAVEISQSFRGTGEWASSLALGTASSDMSGQGDMSYAAKARLTDSGATLKAGLEFDGIRGRAKVGSILGPKIGYLLNTQSCSNMSLRTAIDTISAEDTQDSVFGKLLLYSASLDGRLNGSMAEAVTDGSYMGRPIEISKLKGKGIFEINSSVVLKEYQL